ncbi:MAG: hypothetical protein JXA91_05955 [Candidatus Thermoplasmatota archaeon]|nr:hypothetical protein [Candidatus Thermoplasmatota archaeon]
MKKIFTFLVIFILAISGIGLNVFAEKNDFKTNKTSITNSDPVIQLRDGYVGIYCEESTSFLMQSGRPLIPIFSQTFTYPIGTKIFDVNVNFDVKEYLLPAKIEPAPNPVPLSFEIENEISPPALPDEEIYSSSDPFPSEKYSVRHGMGLKDGKHVIYLNIDCFCQYIPTKDIIFIPEKINIEVKYQEPSESFFNESEYDMLIITDEKFATALDRLVEHKNNIGVKTIIETTQEIYPNYEGRDEAEDIKLRIKDAIEDWGIKYVLLAGGRKGQTYEWYIPDRVVSNDDDSYELGYSSDLYYADIYEIDEQGKPQFSSWDPNGNDLFAEASEYWYPFEIIDHYPDVYVGRIPFRYAWEVDIVIDKIIGYEKYASDEWFKNVVAVAGDTYTPSRWPNWGIYEGEISTDVTAKIFEKAGFNVTRLWTSLGTFSCAEDVQKSISNGSGWVHFSGLGNPALWGSYLPDAQSYEDFICGVRFTDIARGKYTNDFQLPMMIVDGCRTAQFNVTMQQLFDQTMEEIVGRLAWIPSDLCSWFLLNKGGGSIACIGSTGITYGFMDKWVTEGLYGWLCPHFADVYVNQKKNTTGEIWGQGITDYLNKGGSLIEDVNEDCVDRKTVEETVLIGDPSLKLGGYQLDEFYDKKTVNFDGKKYNKEEPIEPCEAPIWNIGQSWVYKLKNLDFALSETVGRDIYLHVDSGYIDLEVFNQSNYSYFVKFNTKKINCVTNIYFDYYINGTNPFVSTFNMDNAYLTGDIVIDKKTLGIQEIQAQLDFRIDTSYLPIKLPPILKFLFREIPLKVNINLKFDLPFSDEPYSFINFPIETGHEWGLSYNKLIINGSAESGCLKLFYLLDVISNFLGKDIFPTEQDKYLPFIDLKELFKDHGILTDLELYEVDTVFRNAPFVCKSYCNVTVPAGTFDAYEISVNSDMADFYYSPEVGNIVKSTAYLADFIPHLKNVELELVDFSKPIIDD